MDITALLSQNLAKTGATGQPAAADGEAFAGSLRDAAAKLLSASESDGAAARPPWRCSMPAATARSPAKPATPCATLWKRWPAAGSKPVTATPCPLKRPRWLNWPAPA